MTELSEPLAGVRERPATFGDALREPIFRTLLLTRSLAIAADTLRILALSVLVLAATGSAWLTAVTFGIGFVPQVVGGTLLGALSDRLPPRGLITAGYLLECGVALLLGALDLPVPVSLALVALVAALTPVFGGASNRVVAESLTGDTYVLGRSLSNVASGGAQLLGLAVGGLAVAGVGARRALLVTAGAHLIAALWLRTGLPRMPRPAAAAGSAMRQSWRVTGALLADRDVRALLLVQWLPPAFVTGAEALVVPYIVARGFPPGTAGLVLACAPVGMLAGNVLVGRLVRPGVRTRLVAPILVVFGAPLVGLAAPVPLPAVAGLLLLVGAGYSYALGVQRPFLDALDTDHRGQGFGLLTTGLMTLQGIGPVVIGALAELFSLPAAMTAAGVGSSMVGLVWWYTRSRAQARESISNRAPAP